jgi:hypothetical protein
MMAQTVAEYGVITSIVAQVSAAWNRFDTFVGGHSTQILVGVVAVLLLLLLTGRRARYR